MRGVAIAVLVVASGVVSGQELLDRVIARVGGRAITLSDARAAAALGLVEIPPGADPVAAAARGLIERQLLLTEVARFSPPEPDAAAVQREVASLERRAGS